MNSGHPNAQTIATPQRGDRLELVIEKTAYEGKALARLENFVVFVDGAIPGDRVVAEVYRRKKQFVEARAVERLEDSLHRVEPRCRHFGVCGGCKWQQLDYREQIQWKREHVIESFERIGKLSDVHVRDTVGAEQRYFYRNKMEFSFGEQRWLLPEELGTVSRKDEPFVLGLHVPGRYDRILHIDECHLQSLQSNAIMDVTRRFFQAHGVAAFSSDKQVGSLRHLVIREAKNTDDRMVYLVTFDEMPELISEYARRLQSPECGVSTFVQGINTRRSDVAVGEREIVHFGEGVIEERIGDIRYRVSPTSFFQTNTVQAKRLYDIALDYADLRSTDRIWDLYCGTGSIALYSASNVRSVLGIELNENAIRNARANAALNDITNAEFECADVKDFARRVQSGEQEVPDAIIVDPPRAGLHSSIIDAIGMMRVRRFVYVSCNPATCARDCASFVEKGYVVEEITPVDMFPHTYHIECVVKLRSR